MFLFLVVKGDLTGRFLQTNGNFAMVWDSLTSTFAVFVKAHLLVIYHTVDIVPRSATNSKNRNAKKRIKNCIIMPILIINLWCF